MSVMGGVVVRHTHDLQMVRLHFFVVQDVNSCASDCSQKPRIVSELFVIPCHKIRPLRCAQLTQRLGCSRSIDCSAVVQIACDEHGIRLLLHHLGHDPLQETAVPHMPQMQVTDERGFAPAPRFRQVLQPDRNSPNPHQTRVEDAEEAAQ